MKLSGKKAIITGANRSIGQAIAIAFAKEGADIVISYRSDEAGAQQTLQKIQEAKVRGKALYADFSELTRVETFFKQAIDFLGSVDILINNAAAYNTSHFLELDIHEFEQLLHINVTVPLFLAQLSARHMIEHQNLGYIINISSISGIRPYPNRSAYSTTKAALNMLTQNLAIDLAPHRIRVNAIAPGTVPYDLNKMKQSPLLDSIPLQRFGKPQDLIDAALYLATEQSSWMTGQILTIDGGQSLSF